MFVPLFGALAWLELPNGAGMGRLYSAQTQSGPPPMEEDRTGWLYKLGA